MLTALRSGEIELSRLVAPRAISAPGIATTAAPYSAEAAPARPTNKAVIAATTMPTAACASTTRHGESCGWRCSNSRASARVYV